MQKFSADYIFPVSSPPIKNGILIIDNQAEIVDILNPVEYNSSLDDVQKFQGIICPGFVNAHCHLELSYLKNKITQKKGLADFIASVEKQKVLMKDKDFILQTISEAEQELIQNGIVAVGDIVNTDTSYEIKRKSKIKFHNFIEVYGSNPAFAESTFNNGKILFEKFNKYFLSSITQHAPYSVSPKLFELIKEHSIENNSILSIHHQESAEENKLFFEGKGKILELLKNFGTDTSYLKPFGKSPLQTISKYLSDKNNVQLVHNTYSKIEDVLFAKSYFNQLWWCFCPNANLFIEDKLPDIPTFISQNVEITIGTDSLASNEKLSLLEELKTISTFFPEISFETLIKWSTLNGASFLKMNSTLGSFDKGKQPGINLIENFDIQKMRLTAESKVTPLV